MVKFIGNWMFANRLWNDSKPTPTVINLNEITNINEFISGKLGRHIRVSLKNNNDVLIEGNIIDVFAKFQEHLLSSN